MPKDDSARAAATTNSRPQNVEAFIIESAGLELSFLPNKGQPRFFVLNLETVLSDLGVNHTKTESYFKRATEVIAEETTWATQFRFDYICSHTQIKPEKRYEAKLFGHAATVIVAMEIIAADIDKTYNVYDRLRIVPATFFIDRFDIDDFYRLDAYYNDLSADRRLEVFGMASEGKDFEHSALTAIGQQNSERLVQQMANGYTATHWVCTAFKSFVEECFPSEFHLDVIRQAGDEDASRPEKGGHRLGSHRAAPALRVPRRRNADQLPPCG